MVKKNHTVNITRTQKGEKKEKYKDYDKQIIYTVKPGYGTTCSMRPPANNDHIKLPRTQIMC